MQMEKVKAEIIVNDYIIKNEGIFENNLLKVKDSETIFTFDLNNLVLIRENKEVKIIIDFKNERLTYKIPETNKEFHNNFTCLALTNKDKEYNIMYQMEQNILNLKIKYEKL